MAKVIFIFLKLKKIDLKVNLVLVETHPVMEMDNVILLQEYALAILASKDWIVLVLNLSMYV